MYTLTLSSTNQYVASFPVILRGRMAIAESGRFCNECGAQLLVDSAYCPKCGAAVSIVGSSVSAAQPKDWRELRRQERARRREERYGRGVLGIGTLVLAAILIVAGLGTYFPQLPLLQNLIYFAGLIGYSGETARVFWGSLLALLGSSVLGLWLLRTRRYTSQRLVGAK